VSRFNRRTFAGFGIGGGWTPAVKALVMACIIGFLLQVFERMAGGNSITREFGLTPSMVTHNFYLWQLVTYMFLHGGFLHIIFNMFGLFMFGSELEQMWRTREFLKYFFICGIGAALTTIVVSPNDYSVTIGASGAIYGILLAYGLAFPNRIIYLYMVIPIPAKWFVVIIGAITFLSSMSAAGSGIAYLAHLGGMLFGLLYLKGGKIFPDFRGRYDRWQRNRLRRKFEVYYNDRRRDDDEKVRRWKN
jgi:membrane associated rhomboid family serine protease